MEITAKANQFIGKLYGFFSNRVVYHTAFWVALVLFYTFLTGTKHGFWFTFSNEIINVFFYAVAVYFNLFYLIPNFLTEKKFIRYCALFMLTVLVVTPLKIFVMYFVLSGHPEMQESLVKNQALYFMLTFLMMGLSTIFKIITEWIRHEREKQELEKQNMQSELRFLKSQINPHFLFNTLNNLYALTLKKSDKAPEIVIKLSEMMRYMLYECNERRVPLSKEVNYIKNYLDLERLRQGKNVDIAFTVNGNVHEQKIAPLMFIPFLENSFKHGLSNNINRGFVNIELDVADNEIHLFIENSKPDALPNQMHKRSGGIGLVNVRRRLNLLYPNNYQLDIRDQPDKYAVNLKLDITK